ncbi:molybdopterin synthase sulfur carrier subunit [Alkalispirillum mobile]|uniref:Molybdopterin synthase sulfur carrier subunit n=1 Tax=Alkalispirillum mobile TaxID=85925 RepID=A0A498C8V9_9GAMM|nr:MoaD/ThiS family protein [Alkalispirillum mobile]RLK51549.1 molybdopterin synthase sulfur carrier subunit [Alkalispirillum mobile]
MQVEFYGILEEVVGQPRMTLELAEGATVADALEALAGQQPELAPHLARVAYAVGDELVGKDTRLKADDTLVLLPPVSGG